MGDISGADDLRKPVTYQDKNKVGSPVSPRTTADVFRVPTSQISPNPYQPRLSFDSEELEGLAASIRTLGLITPITVRKIAENRYQIISGERRYRACQMVGMTEIPAYIRETDDQGMLEMAIVENVQRENLDPIEVALSYQRLLTECNLTQEQMADTMAERVFCCFFFWSLSAIRCFFSCLYKKRKALRGFPLTRACKRILLAYQYRASCDTAPHSPGHIPR